MKNYIKLPFIILLGLIMSTNQLISQNRLTIDCTILKNNKYLIKQDEPFIVKIIDENLNTLEFEVYRKFTYDLDYNNNYKIVFYGQDCQVKYINLNTKTKDRRKVRYMFVVNLIESTEQTIHEAGSIFYNPEIHQFDYIVNKQ